MLASFLRVLAAALVLILISVSAAWADRDPTPEERAAIGKVLRAQGYQSWRDIKFADDAWDVDAARTTDGQQYDLKLDPINLTIIETEKAY